MVKFMRSDRITAQGGFAAGLLTSHHAAVTGMCHLKPVMTHLPVKEAAHRHLSRPLAGSLWGKPLRNSSPNVGWPHLPDSKGQPLVLLRHVLSQLRVGSPPQQLSQTSWCCLLWIHVKSEACIYLAAVSISRAGATFVLAREICVCLGEEAAAS